jgi:NADPH-dependent F420 reductase
VSSAKVAVLGGTGQHGRGIAQRLARAGFPIVVGSRDPARASSTIANWPAAAAPIDSADYGDAIAAARIVVLAVPFHSVHGLLEHQRGRFSADSLVIDVTVPLVFTGGTVSLSDLPEGSASEHVRTRLPPSVRVAAAFKTIPASVLHRLEQPLDCDEFVCGDSAEARSETIAILRSIPGLRPVDVGPLVRARAIEHLTVLAIAINRRHRVHEARYRVVGL